MLAFVSMLTLLLLSGCAGGGPVIAGRGYFGIGFFQDRTQSADAAQQHVDVEGVGLLFAKGRVALGYARLCHVTADADSSIHLKLSGAEIALGADADTWALEINAANERQWVETLNASNEEE